MSKDLDEGEAGGGGEGGGDVADAEEDGEEHGEAEGAVECDGGHEAPGNDGGGVFDLFAHVDGAVGTYGRLAGWFWGRVRRDGISGAGLLTEEGEDGGDDADEEGKALALVAAVVKEGGEDVFGGAVGGEVGHGD